MAQAFEVIRPTSSQTIIEFVIDETGSMESCRDTTISGFNEYVNSQKNQQGACLLTLTKFDQTGVRNVYTDVLIENAPVLNRETYKPNSMTNLYDAIGVRIKALEERIANSAEQPNILFVIMTDGDDNCSRTYSPAMLKEMIKGKEAEGWTFTFLGANQDAWSVGQTFGMAKGNTMTYDTKNMADTMSTLSGATAAYRSVRASGAMASTEATRDFFSAVVPPVGK